MLYLSGDQLLETCESTSSKQFPKSLFMYLKSFVNLKKRCILKLSEYQNKLKESCSQVVFASLIPAKLTQI